MPVPSKSGPSPKAIKAVRKWNQKECGKKRSEQMEQMGHNVE